MRIIVIGSNGQLGSDLSEVLAAAGHEVIGLSHTDIEIRDIDSVAAVLRTQQPDAVLNTAAYHVVPKCEEEPQVANAVNNIGALNVARVCNDIGALNVYYSTDYVFDGEKKSPYIESDKPSPLNVYGISKLAGEFSTLKYCQKPFVIRVSGIYGKIPCRAKGANFITTMLRVSKEKPEVRVVADEVLTPTPTREIALATLPILLSGATGLFHLTCEGECSWFQFAQVIFDTLKIKTPLQPSSVKDTPITVCRPYYSVLENAHAKQLKIPSMPHWKEALQEFLNTQYS